MCFTSSDTAEMWAKNQAANEADAFEKAIKRIKPDDMIKQLELENAELRRQHIEDSRTICKLRETIRRGQDNYE